MPDSDGMAGEPVGQRLSAADLAVVRQTPLFSGVGPESLQPLLANATVQRLPAARRCFLQGDPADAFFVVLDGWIKLYRLSSTGEEAVMAVFTRGQSFAEAAAFALGTFPVSAETATDARLLRIPTGNLEQLICQMPEIALAMLASTSRHLHALVQQIEQLKTHTGAQRVAEFLVSLCPVAEGSCNIGLPYDKALIAARLGMKPESLSRAFSKLRGYGVRIQHNTAVIQDVRRLVGYIEEEQEAGWDVSQS
jgi:CRP/FNR family transcriptional regulator, dissimilatory nitrate respiration regulator